MALLVHADHVRRAGFQLRRIPDFTADCSDSRIISCYFKADNTRLGLNGMCEISWKTQAGERGEGWGGRLGENNISCELSSNPQPARVNQLTARTLCLRRERLTRNGPRARGSRLEARSSRAAAHQPFVFAPSCNRGNISALPKALFLLLHGGPEASSPLPTARLPSSPPIFPANPLPLQR